MAHETTHFRHGDPIWALLRGVRGAHWYNPWCGGGRPLPPGRGRAPATRPPSAPWAKGRGAYARTLLRLTCGNPPTASPPPPPWPAAPGPSGSGSPASPSAPAGRPVSLSPCWRWSLSPRGAPSRRRPSGAVPIQREFDGEVPEAVAALTENAIADIAAGYNEDGAEGGYVTEAKLTGLTPVPIEVSTGDAGVAVYRVEYRLHVRNGPAYLLAGGAQAEPPLPLAGCGLRNGPVPASPTTLSTGRRRTERPPGSWSPEPTAIPWPLTTATTAWKAPSRTMSPPLPGRCSPSTTTGFLSHLPSLRKSLKRCWSTSSPS